MQNSNEILNQLLKDQTSGKNIIWATNVYSYQGISFDNQITINNIVGNNENKIIPRSKKTRQEKDIRIKSNAEVFTPTWMCNIQNNLVDDTWFDRKNVFNIPYEKTWKTNTNKIEFEKFSWQDYVKDLRLEITCGEAPYLVSRYDSITGDEIVVENRIGLLDRKLRVVSENVDFEDEWIKWAIIALKSIYGFELQGDNLYLARLNIFNTLIDFFKFKFHKDLPSKVQKEIAQIISWNIWQMDRLKYIIPNSCKCIKEIICEGCLNNDYTKHNGIYCKIMDWEKNKKITFITLLKKSFVK